MFRVFLIFLIRSAFGNVCFCASFDSNIYEITARKNIDVFWNIPSFQCDYHQLNFTGLAAKYDILQNYDDRFRGDVIDILYDPGSFPAILKDGTKTVFRNGGIPQRGNLTFHLELFAQMVNQQMDKDFSGLAVIDFESWRPVFRQNFGTLSPYKELSIAIERKAHPLWPNFLVEKEARRKWEFYAQQFVEETLYYAKKLRKNATWGYYAYPYCFNMSPGNMMGSCSPEVVEENDNIAWLYKVTDNLHPSLYLSEGRLTSSEKMKMIEGRINEANRIRSKLSIYNSIKLYPYFWYKYQDSKNFVTKEDLFNSFLMLSALEIDGLIIWGSSNDVNNKKRCYELYDYIDNTFGPALTTLR